MKNENICPIRNENISPIKNDNIFPIKSDPIKNDNTLYLYLEKW